MAIILITGGAGYIGNMIRKMVLQVGHYVRIADALWFKEGILHRRIRSNNRCSVFLTKRRNSAKVHKAKAIKILE